MPPTKPKPDPNKKIVVKPQEELPADYKFVKDDHSRDPLQDKPTKNIVTTSKYHTLQGRRKRNEDDHLEWNHPRMNEKMGKTDGVMRTFYCVFDGHGGVATAEYCGDHLGSLLCRELQENDDPRVAMHKALIQCDKDLDEDQEDENTGATAICVYIEGNNMYVANLGDSRAVLYRDGTAKPLSFDHKVTDKLEKDHIISLGGAVCPDDPSLPPEEPPTCFCAKCWWHCMENATFLQGAQRLWPGGLQVARAIGDFRSKPMCTNDSDLFQYKLEDKDAFIVIACDGVWDVVKNETACNVVNKDKGDPEKSCKRLAEYAFEHGSTDNISVLIVKLGERTTL